MFSILKLINLKIVCPDLSFEFPQLLNLQYIGGISYIFQHSIHLGQLVPDMIEILLELLSSLVVFLSLNFHFVHFFNFIPFLLLYGLVLAHNLLQLQFFLQHSQVVDLPHYLLVFILEFVVLQGLVLSIF